MTNRLSIALHLTFLNVLLICLVAAQQSYGQVKTQTPPDDDVIRVKTELVQTDVTVGHAPEYPRTRH